MRHLDSVLFTPKSLYNHMGGGGGGGVLLNHHQLQVETLATGGEERES